MSARDGLIGLLLLVGVLSTFIACVGVWVGPRFYARLHYIGVAATVAVVALATAIAVEEGTTGATTKTLLTALVIAVGSPVLTHATARAAWIRKHGRWTVPPDDHALPENAPAAAADAEEV